MSNSKNNQKEKLTEIKNLILGFCDEFLLDEYEDFFLNLAEALGRKRTLDLSRSKSEQWAASIIYAIARLNFLFDPDNLDHITTDDICFHFGTKKSTTGNKATQIEKMCDVHYGREDYCIEGIRDIFTFYETEDGFIIPKIVVDRQLEAMAGVNTSDNNVVLPELSIEEKRKIEKQKELEKAREKADRARTDENQLGLFDN